MSALTAEISKSCSCSCSIGRVKLNCEDDNTDRVVVEGTIIVAQPETSEEELHKHLQSWVDTSPTLVVAGVQLAVVRCSTYSSDDKSCELKDPLPIVSTSKLSSEFSVFLYSSIGVGVVNVPTSKLKYGRSSVFLYGGIGVGVLVVLLLACFSICLLVWGVQRKRRQMKIHR